jgi:hypothetical protein
MRICSLFKIDRLAWARAWEAEASIRQGTAIVRDARSPGVSSVHSDDSMRCRRILLRGIHRADFRRKLREDPRRSSRNDANAEKRGVKRG